MGGEGSEPKRAAAADSAEVEARVREGLEFVPYIARHLARQLGMRSDTSELESAGRTGLLLAARSFDPARGVPFRKWINLKVRGAMIDAMRTTSGLPRAAYRKLRAMEAADRTLEGRVEDDAATPAGNAEAADAKLGEALSGMAQAMAVGFLTANSDGLERVRDADLSPEEAVAEKEMLERLRAIIDKRPEAERQLIVRHYFDGVTFDEAAKELGLSKSWASRLHARAMAALAEEARAAFADSL